MKSMRKIINTVHLITVVVAVAFLITLVVIITVHVMLRYVFKSGINWSEEVASKILMPAFVFLGMAMGVEEGLHININVLPRKLPPLIDNMLTNLKHVCTILIGVVLVYYGIYLVKFQNQFGVVLPATEWPSSLQFIILPVAGGLIILISILNILKMPRDEKYIDRIIGREEEG